MNDTRYRFSKETILRCLLTRLNIGIVGQGELNIPEGHDFIKSNEVYSVSTEVVLDGGQDEESAKNKEAQKTEEPSPDPISLGSRSGRQGQCR